MSGANKALVVGIVATLGLWGCARGPSSASVAAERIRALEIKVTKLEEDFRAAASARDVLRQKLVAADEERKNLETEVGHLRPVVKERDDLRKQLAARIVERETVQTQFDQFRKGIRDLLGQADAAVGGQNSQPVTAIVPAATPGKS